MLMRICALYPKLIGIYVKEVKNQGLENPDGPYPIIHRICPGLWELTKNDRNKILT